MKIAFVPDGGPKTGLGHLGRCVAIAQSIERVSRIKPVFINADRESRGWIKERGFASQPILSGRWDLVVLDSYLKKKNEISKLRQQADVFATIDDFGQPPVGADWVINTAVCAHEFSYARSNAKGLLLGPSFHPLRKEFLASSRDERAAASVKNIVVSLGGTSGHGLLSVLLDRIADSFPAATVHAIVGLYSELAPRPGRRVVYHRSPDNMRKILSEMDLAVSAGGQTLFELAFMGIPTLAIEIADNQHENLRGFTEAGAVLAMGRAQDRALPGRVIAALRRLIGNLGQRREMSYCGRRLVDGRGGERLAKVLVS